MSHQWQDDFPATEAISIGSAIRGGGLTFGMIRVAWVVAEYGLGQLVNAEAVRGVEVKEPKASPKKAMQLLEEHAKAQQSGDPASRAIGPPLPWRSIVAAILSAIAAAIGKPG